MSGASRDTRAELFGGSPKWRHARRRLGHQVAIGLDLTLRIYREVLVLQMLGDGFGLLRLDLLGRGVQ